MLIIREAFYGVARFEDILEDLQIPRSVLTTRLKQLVEIGVLVKVPYRPPGSRGRFGYRLSDKGKELGLTILALMQWGDKHLNDGVSAISLSDKKTKKALVVGLVPADANALSLSDAKVEIKGR